MLNNYIMAKHNELGRLGERLAARHLLLNGYSIMACDWHYGHKDIDIICSKDGTTVFVEVKTRASDAFGDPEEAVDYRKMRNLVSAAQVYMARNEICGPVRFDIISVVGVAEPFKITHLPDAFNPYSLTQY